MKWGQLVLRENYLQPRSISFIQAQSAKLIELHIRYMTELERLGKLDRELEFLPDDQQLMERRLLGQGLTAPGIAALLC